MLKKTVIFILLCFFISVHVAMAQQSILFDSLTIYPFKTLSLKGNVFHDFKPFENLLKNNDLLILSEGGHADGATYDAQCMIIKGLIDLGKIQTVYTESSWLNIEKINSILKKYGKDSVKAVEKYMSSVELVYWTHNGFWYYLADKIIDNKVRLVGIDIETTSELVTKELLSEAIKEDSSLVTDEYKEVMADLANPLNWIYDVNYSETFYRKSSLFIERIMHRYSKVADFYKVKQWQRILDYQNFRYHRNLDSSGNRVLNPFDDWVKETYFNSIRDSIMCDILLEDQALKNSGKAVLLIASYHAMRNSELVEKLDKFIKYNFVKTFGEILNRKSNLKFYNICFVTSSGIRGAKQFSKKHYTNVKKPKKGSLEEYFSRQEAAYFFTDLQQSSTKEIKFLMNPFNKNYLYANWGKVFSGVFFIKEMYPQDFDAIVY